MELYPIHVLSERSGVTIKAIRYYSNQGLLPPAETTPTGYRMYSDRELTRLYQIVGLRWLGASIRQIRELLEQHLSLHELLDLQVTAITDEMARLRRLQSRVQAAKQMLAQKDSLASDVLQDLGQSMQSTQNQRRAWFKDWLRQRAGTTWSSADLDALVPIGGALYEGEPDGLKSLVLHALKTGQSLPEGLPGAPNDWGVETVAATWSEWPAQQREALTALRQTMDFSPADARVQSALRAWIGTFGPVNRHTVAQIQAAWESAEAHRLAQRLAVKAGQARTDLARQHLQDALDILATTLSQAGPTAEQISGAARDQEARE